MEVSLQYPIGHYVSKPFSEKQKKQWLSELSWLPADLENAVLNLDAAQIQTPYREGGWTVNQLVHHVADSHLNAYTRFKLGLTEDRPTIRPYDEKKWAELNDVAKEPVNTSITLLFALHRRWVAALESLSDAEWTRTVQHPESTEPWTLWYLLGMYVWHGQHHTQHILKLRERNGW
ncbi:MAG: bacillithiol transferase BstA [Chitinophagaceae bacterium]